MSRLRALFLRPCTGDSVLRKECPGCYGKCQNETVTTRWMKYLRSVWGVGSPRLAMPCNATDVCETKNVCRHSCCVAHGSKVVGYSKTHPRRHPPPLRATSHHRANGGIPCSGIRGCVGVLLTHTSTTHNHPTPRLCTLRAPRLHFVVVIPVHPAMSNV